MADAHGCGLTAQRLAWQDLHRSASCSALRLSSFALATDYVSRPGAFLSFYRHRNENLIVVNAVEKGKRAERVFAEYLRSAGWPDAERTVSTGFATANRSVADIGDIKGTPYTWQLKHYQDGLSDLQIAQMLAETEAQSVAARSICGVLVERRNGKSDAGLWWCWLYAHHLGQLLGLDRANPFVAQVPVRMRADQLVPIMLAADTPALSATALSSYPRG